MGGAWTEQRSQAYAWHYSVLIQSLRKLDPAPKIVICVPPPCYSTTGGLNQTIINTVLPDLVRQVAQAHGVGLPIDTFTVFKNHCQDFTKGSTCDWLQDAEVHPNADGYYQIATLVSHPISTG